MAKLGKHIYNRPFDLDNQIDLNYKIFPDSFTFGGPTGGSAAVADNFYYDYSSITNWDSVRDVLGTNSSFVIDEIDLLYQAAGGLTAFPGLTFSEQEALSRNFLIPKAERNTIHTEEEQRINSEELYLAIEQDYINESLNNITDYIVTSDNGDVQTFIENPINFTIPGGGGGGGSVSSVNGQVGNVILGLNELDDVNTSGISTNHILTYNGANWVTELRPPLTIHSSSQNYLNYNSTTGELFMESLAITDVTVENTATSAEIWLNDTLNASAHEQGDTIIFTNTTYDTEVYMHNGGSSIDFTDYTRIKSGAASESFTRSLFSGVSPVEYDYLTGAISMTNSSTQSSGFLSQTDFNTFNNKVDSVNGKYGNVLLSSSNITEGVNLYYTDTRARHSITGGTGINYNPITGVIESNISGAVNSVNGKTGVVLLTLDDLVGIDNTGVTGGYVLTYDGFTWSGATAVNSINGQFGEVSLTTLNIIEDTNLYYTDTRARQSISGSTGIGYNNNNGVISLDANTITGNGLTTTDGYTIETLLILNSGLSFSSGAIDLNIGIGLTNVGGVIAANINDSSTNSTNELWSTNKIYTELQLISSSVSNSVTSVNGYSGSVTLDTDDITEGSENLYFTQSLARDSFYAIPPIIYQPSVGKFTLPKATSTIDGYLDNIDWILFNDKIGTINGLTGASVSLNLDDLDGVNNTGLTSGYVLTYNGTEWSGSESFNGGVTSVNGLTGSVTLHTDDISDFGQTNKYYTDTLARNAIGVSASSGNYLTYNSTTGLFNLSSLAISNVIVDSTYTMSTDYFHYEYTGSEIQEGDTVVMTAITNGTETYMHNGGTYGTSADFVLIQSPNVTDVYIRNLVSGTSPIAYEPTSGAFSITQATSILDGYLNSLDFITFNNKIGSINGLTGASVSLTLDDIIDVDTTTATASVDDLLKWNGTNWVPTTPISKKSWSWGASRNSNSVTNSYLRQFNGTPTNQSSYVAFMDCKIKNMSVGSNDNESWIAETRINGVASATMSVSSTSFTYSSFDVSVNAGDKISFYCNGSDIDRPNIQILIEEI